jgi:hypothetical protein
MLRLHPLSLSPRLTLLQYTPLTPLYCSERHRYGRAMTSSASSTSRRLARSCCQVPVTRTALVSVSSEPKHSERASRDSLVQRQRDLQLLRHPLPRHLGLSLLSLRRAVRHVRLHLPAMGMDLGFDPALLQVPLPDFDDVDVDDARADPCRCCGACCFCA